MRTEERGHEETGHAAGPPGTVKEEDRKALEGKRVEVKHASGEYRGEVRDVSKAGFMLYSQGPTKPAREAGRYFSWDSVQVREAREAR